MKRIDKLKELNAEIQNLQPNNDLGFFSYTLPQKINELIPLIEIHTDELVLGGISDFAKGLITHAVNSLMAVKSNESPWEKDYTLKTCKKAVDTAVRQFIYQCRTNKQKKVKGILLEDDQVLKD